MSFIPSLFILLTLVSFIFGQQQEKPWQEFVSEEGNFAVLMPGTPLPQPPIDSGGIEVHNYTYSQKELGYLISYNILPSKLLKQVSTKETLDFTVRGLLGRANGKLISSSDIKLDDYPGKKVKIEGNNLFFYGQIFVVKQRVYYVMVLSKMDPSSLKESETFLSSFKLVSIPVDEENLPKQELTLNKLYSEAGNFSVDIPGKPQQSAIPTTTIDNLKLELRTFATTTPSTIYVASYFDLPKENLLKNRPKELFDYFRNSIATTNNSKLIEESELKLEKHPGRFFKFKEDNGATITSKVYLVNQRLYLISVTNADSQEVKPELTDKFLNSFQLLGRDFDDPFEDNTPLIGGVVKDKDSKETSNADNSTASAGSTNTPSSTTNPPEKTRDLSKGVLRGNAVEKPSPEYPIEAKQQRIEGDVVVRIVIDKDGKVPRAQIISGAMVFHDAAIKAAKDWRFNPSLLDGKPVRVVGDLTFRFKLP